jgi:hypothetical protein
MKSVIKWTKPLNRMSSWIEKIYSLQVSVVAALINNNNLLAGLLTTKVIHCKLESKRLCNSGFNNQGVTVRVLKGSRIFTSPCCLDQLWARPISYPMGTRSSFPGSKAAHKFKLSIHPQLPLRSRKCDLHMDSPMRLHGVVLNWLSTGIYLPTLMRLQRCSLELLKQIWGHAVA